MAYRQLKRVLGESSLERKCRLLFGTCLLLLIGGAFYWVDSIAEGLVIDATRNKGRHLVDIALLKVHFERWETQAEFKELAKQVMADIAQEQNYEHEILMLDDLRPVNNVSPKPPSDEVERSRLEKLRDKLASLAEGQRAPLREKTPAEVLQDGPSLIDLGEEGRPAFEERVYAADNDYHYYEAVRWKKSCQPCHLMYQEAGVVPLSEAAPVPPEDMPLRVVKVIIPYRETQTAINSVRAILIAVAIVTVFFAMIALYVIVRYVVVKPLKHLRDVSDDISRGKTELRADIHTNDEFEELAGSFNRMLRHMTETQGELQQVNDALDHKVDQLAQLNMQLYEMNRLKGDFLANMSHELRTPLNSIIGFSEVLQGIDSLNDKQKRYAQNIQKSGRVLLEMINDILDLAKMEAGKMEVRPSEFSIATICRAQGDMVRSLTDEKNIDLEVRVDDDLPDVYQDQAKIQQILNNLLSNAIKFTPEGGRITVQAGRDHQGRLKVTVADTGVGIAAEDREIVFEKFRQGTVVLGGDTLTREYSGTGLGLSILKELCKLLGGEVSFDSEVGVGSTFQVLLPWHCRTESHGTDISAKLDELTRPHRSDFEATPKQQQTEPA